MIEIPTNLYGAEYNAAIVSRLDSLSSIALYMEAPDLEEFYSRLAGSGVKIVDPIADRPWGQGEFTIEDILKELEKPGRDPRATIEEFRFDETIKSIEDVKPGMQVPGGVNRLVGRILVRLTDLLPLLREVRDLHFDLAHLVAQLLQPELLLLDHAGGFQIE